MDRAADDDMLPSNRIYLSEEEACPGTEVMFGEFHLAASGQRKFLI